MSQLSLEQQVRGIVIRANFADPAINTLVKDVTQLKVDDVVKQATTILESEEAKGTRDAQNADILLGSIERLRRIDQVQNTPTENDKRQRAKLEMSNPLNRSDLR